MNNHISKLSRGPRNPRHAVYKKNYSNIHKSLCKHLSNRCLNVKTKDIYQSAGITPPTFYYHYHNSSEALHGYERYLREGFYVLISSAVTTVTKTTGKRETFFAILTEYIVRNRQYFLAAHRAGSNYLLIRILKHHRSILASEDVSDRSFAVYLGILLAVINCWLEFDKINKATAAKCAQQLKAVRIIRAE